MSFGTALAGPKTASSATDVRVNGYLVEFPDEKPFVNSDNRTMIPVRFRHRGSRREGLLE